MNKPAGMTSFGVVHRIRKQLGIKRVGHAGTLDPFATGVLIVAAGRQYTRQLDQWQAKPKTYLATMELGKTSDTLDIDGKEWQADADFLAKKSEIITTLNEPHFWQRWEGEQLQTPPAYSAKKIQGTPAYKLARKNKAVVLAPVTITIHAIRRLEMSESDGRLLVTFEVTCSKGTYIRQLAADMAAALGTLGYLSALSRTAVGEATLAQAQPIDALGVPAR